MLVGWLRYCKVAAQVLWGFEASNPISEYHLNVWRDILTGLKWDSCDETRFSPKWIVLVCSAVCLSRAFIYLFILSQLDILTYLHKLPFAAALSALCANPFIVCALCVINCPVLMMRAGTASQPKQPIYPKEHSSGFIINKEAWRHF